MECFIESYWKFSEHQRSKGIKEPTYLTSKRAKDQRIILSTINRENSTASHLNEPLGSYRKKFMFGKPPYLERRAKTYINPTSKTCLLLCKSATLTSLP